MEKHFSQALWELYKAQIYPGFPPTERGNIGINNKGNEAEKKYRLDIKRMYSTKRAVTTLGNRIDRKTPTDAPKEDAERK